MTLTTPNYVRGSTVNIAVRFFDSAGQITNPVSATLYIDYPDEDGVRQQANYDLALSVDNWVYDWDSSVAGPGKVYAHARTDGDAPISSVDLQFNLTANSANPAPV
jgi:hypothetical protein